MAPPATPFNTVFQHQGEIVSLSVLPTGDAPEADAALLLLLGYLWFTKQELVTGGRLGQGLARSGLNVARTDRVLADYMPQLVIRVGQHRGTRYRLTNPGKLRAEQMVRDLAATVG